MNLGTPEILMMAFLALPIVGIVFAAIDGAWKWLIAIILTTPFLAGWIVAIVYLVRRRSGMPAASR